MFIKIKPRLYMATSIVLFSRLSSSVSFYFHSADGQHKVIYCNRRNADQIIEILGFWFLCALERWARAGTLPGQFSSKPQRLEWEEEVDLQKKEKQTCRTTFTRRQHRSQSQKDSPRIRHEGKIREHQAPARLSQQEEQDQIILAPRGTQVQIASLKTREVWDGEQKLKKFYQEQQKLSDAQ